MFELVGKVVFVVGPGAVLGWLVFMAVLLGRRSGGREWGGLEQALGGAFLAFCAWLAAALWWLT